MLKFSDSVFDISVIWIIRSSLRYLSFLLKTCSKTITIEGGGRPTRLLPHAKMLLVPIKFFPLLGRLCSGRFYIFTEQMWFLAACFTAERSWHTYRFTGPAGFVLWYKRIFFVLVKSWSAIVVFLEIRGSIYLFLSDGRKMTPSPETVSDLWSDVCRLSQLVIT